MDHLVSTDKMVSEEVTAAAMVYRTVTEYLLVETVTTAVVPAMEEVARTVEETATATATAEEAVSAVVNLPVLMEHHPMVLVETEVQELEDRRAATEHLVEEMDSAVEAMELARMGSAVVQPAVMDHPKVEMALVVAVEVELRLVSMDLLVETEMEETVELVAMGDDRQEATVRLRETEVDHRDFMDHLVEMVAGMEDITVLMLAMVDIRQEDRVEMQVVMVVIPLEALVVMAVVMAVGMVVIPLEVQVAMEEAMVVIPLVVQVEMVAVTEVMVKMKVMNQRNTNFLTKSRTSNLELIMAIRKAETAIVHRESSTFCFPMAESKLLSTRPIKMDLNLKLDTRAKRIKDTDLGGQEVMVETMDIQVADLTGVDPVAMVIHQEGPVVDLTSAMEVIHPEDQVVTMAVTETETTEATLMVDIRLEVEATLQLTEDTSTKYSSRCSNIYRVYYEKGIHRATFIITHRIIFVWNSRNAAIIANDDNFSIIEFLRRCLIYLIVLAHFQLNIRKTKKTIARLTPKTSKFLCCNASFLSDVLSFLV